MPETGQLAGLVFATDDDECLQGCGEWIYPGDSVGYTPTGVLCARCYARSEEDYA